MSDKRLSLNQQLALMPVAVPDSILDFLEDFNYGSALQTESGRSSLDAEYLKHAEESLRAELEKLRAEQGKLQEVQVDAAGRDIPGGFLVKLSFERGAPRGMGLLTRLKERTIFRVLFSAGAYDEPSLRELLKNPPKPA